MKRTDILDLRLGTRPKVPTDRKTLIGKITGCGFEIVVDNEPITTCDAKLERNRAV